MEQRTYIRRFRFLMLGLFSFGLLAVVAMLDPEQQAIGWIVTSVLAVIKGVLASTVFYGLLRVFLHYQTHEVSKEWEARWNIALMLSVALVFGLTSG